MKSHEMPVFVSCAPADEPYVDEFDRHLASLVRKGTLSVWHPASRAPKPAGAEAGHGDEQARKNALESARLMLLLQSRDYFASEFCNAEWRRALELEREGKLRIVRIGLRGCDVPAELLDLECIPQRAEPIYHWASHDDFWNAVLSALRRLIEHPKQHES